MSEHQRQDLEIILAHQDRQIQDLNDMITRQWQEIDALKRLLGRIVDKVTTLEASSPSGDGREDLSVAELAALEKPPHY